MSAERRGDETIARESARRVEPDPSICEPICIGCENATDGKNELCRACIREMAADRRRDEPEERAERLLRMMEDE